MKFIAEAALMQLYQSHKFEGRWSRKFSLILLMATIRCIGCPNSVSKPSVNQFPDVLVKRIQNIDVDSINKLSLSVWRAFISSRIAGDSAKAKFLD